MALTITEGLSEIKTIRNRIAKKQEFIQANLARSYQLRDPLDKDGGQAQVIAQELQSIRDLEERQITLRRAIDAANEATSITVGGTTRTIADWLIWRREIAPGRKNLLNNVTNIIRQVRQEAQRKAFAVVTTGDVATKDTDVIINVDERELAASTENLEEILGNLDGQLQLKNATVTLPI